jgi:hypothetical protein
MNKVGEKEKKGRHRRKWWSRGKSRRRERK